MVTDLEQFEYNLMPKLIAEIKANGGRARTFDTFRIRSRDRTKGGLGTSAWEGKDLFRNLHRLVKKGWIKSLPNGSYILTYKGKFEYRDPYLLARQRYERT